MTPRRTVWGRWDQTGPAFPAEVASRDEAPDSSSDQYDAINVASHLRAAAAGEYEIIFATKSIDVGQ
ncbi:hypothetical protein Q1695_001950 [Nippostrongylus brasiliensis]|nr:hypothetical protein Q1695_001950 [Nippostrongylus brasiliensis]